MRDKGRLGRRSEGERDGEEEEKESKERVGEGERDG